MASFEGRESGHVLDATGCDQIPQTRHFGRIVFDHIGYTMVAQEPRPKLEGMCYWQLAARIGGIGAGRRNEGAAHEEALALTANALIYQPQTRGIGPGANLRQLSIRLNDQTLDAPQYEWSGGTARDQSKSADTCDDDGIDIRAIERRQPISLQQADPICHA
jgi:hypothetical protein